MRTSADTFKSCATDVYITIKTRLSYGSKSVCVVDPYVQDAYAKDDACTTDAAVSASERSRRIQFSSGNQK